MLPTTKTILLRNVRSSLHNYTENAETAQLPYLNPRDVLVNILQKHPWLLLGGLDPGVQSREMLRTFWNTYQSEHPTHMVFRRAAAQSLKLETTIPVMLHGDGGRTVKKQPLEVVSLVAVLGLDTYNDLKCSCPTSCDFTTNRDTSDPLLQKLNNRNHSYLTHFLLFAFPSKKFKKTPGLLKSMLRRVSQDMARVCSEGISIGAEHYNFAVIGLRGDAEWHSKTGILQRSYQNVGHVNEKACCHLCSAGSPGVDFENFRSDAPWKATFLTSVPWAEPPPYDALEFEDWGTGPAAAFFRHDPFHVFRLGIARNFIASCLIFLCLETFYDDPTSPGESLAIAERLSRAWSHFSLWCEVTGKKPASIRSFSKEKLHFATGTSFPFVGCKGADTILLLKYLKFFSSLKINELGETELLRLIKLGCEQGLAFQAIHRHGIWLPAGCRKQIFEMANGFCKTYSRLAALAYSQRLTLFGLVPKAHALGHIYFDLERTKNNSFSINPATWDTSSSEDFVGRVSRQSRRIGYRCIVSNTLLAYKVKANFVIQRFGKSRRRQWPFGFQLLIPKLRCWKCHLQ